MEAVAVERQVYNVAEAAAVLGISKPKLYQLCQSDNFPRVHLGARIVIPKDKLHAWLDEQASQNTK